MCIDNYLAACLRIMHAPYLKTLAIYLVHVSDLMSWQYSVTFKTAMHPL